MSTCMNKLQDQDYGEECGHCEEGGGCGSMVR
jgi:hypothetical protein